MIDKGLIVIELLTQVGFVNIPQLNMVLNAVESFEIFSLTHAGLHLTLERVAWG